MTDFTLRRRQPCRLATINPDTRATLPPETATRGPLHFPVDGMMTANEVNALRRSVKTIVNVQVAAKDTILGHLRRTGKPLCTIDMPRNYETQSGTSAPPNG